MWSLTKSETRRDSTVEVLRRVYNRKESLEQSTTCNRCVSSQEMACMGPEQRWDVPDLEVANLKSGTGGHVICMKHRRDGTGDASPWRRLELAKATTQNSDNSIYK